MPTWLVLHLVISNTNSASTHLAWLKRAQQYKKYWIDKHSKMLHCHRHLEHRNPIFSQDNNDDNDVPSN